jgi:hypothetical protein
MEITDQQKQQILDFREWVKAHPEIATIFRNNTKSRTLLTLSRFQKFRLREDVLSAICEYGNEELLFGYYLRDTIKDGE